LAKLGLTAPSEKMVVPVNLFCIYHSKKLPTKSSSQESTFKLSGWRIPAIAGQ